MKKYDEWNEVKKDIAIKNKNLIFKVREIFWVQLGQNIGFETDGKGNKFLRPVLIIRKFSKDSFLGIPLTTSIKDDMFHYKFTIKSNKKINYANLSQIKLFDAKRLSHKLGSIDKVEFTKLTEKLKRLIFE
jgi:mRNA-degrading endonuclease toxin of MazEF toxin-antitoxin module